MASESESRHSTGLEAPGVPEQPSPVQASTKTPVPEERRSLEWQPVSPSQEPQPVETPAVEESAIVRSESEKLEEPKQVQSPAESISKASPAPQKPSPVPKPAKKVVRKPVAAARQGARTNWIIAFALGCAVTVVVSIAVYKPAVVDRVKDTYGIWSVKIKEDVYSLVNKKQEPKPVITEPAQPSVITPSEPVIIRPSKFHEVAGTWTGTLRNDRRGTRWTFSFNPTNYNVSIKNESGLWVTGTAVFHWDKGSLIGDTLRTAPKWNSLDIDIIKSSVSEYAGKVSLGAFSRNENALKLCMSSPGKMIEPTETDSTGEIQCFDLKKKGSAN